MLLIAVGRVGEKTTRFVFCSPRSLKAGKRPVGRVLRGGDRDIKGRKGYQEGNRYNGDS